MDKTFTKCFPIYTFERRRRREGPPARPPRPSPGRRPGACRPPQGLHLRPPGQGLDVGALPLPHPGVPLSAHGGDGRGPDLAVGEEGRFRPQGLRGQGRRRLPAPRGDDLLAHHILGHETAGPHGYGLPRREHPGPPGRRRRLRAPAFPRPQPTGKLPLPSSAGTWTSTGTSTTSFTSTGPSRVCRRRSSAGRDRPRSRSSTRKRPSTATKWRPGPLPDGRVRLPPSDRQEGGWRRAGPASNVLALRRGPQPPGLDGR